MKTLSEFGRCQRCGSPLPQIGDLFGRCPECMLELGFEEPVDDGEYPATIGRYRILRLIGEGGMGAVYEAEQEHPSRVVALKIIKHGMASPALLRRFEQEAEALGRLQHPGIAQIYEAGTVDTGFGLQPYFAMELIRGSAPLDYAEAHQLSTRERLEIMAKVCDAVHHAHQRGLIHRDLKPANILVDDSGQPKVLDFGVARVTDSDSRATSQTEVGQLVGTLAYMSPEQVLADPFEIDTRSDVYSLGVVLYELLTARLPYAISKKIHEAIQTIRDVDSQRLSVFDRAYRGDIETIAAKALEKDKARRYESAAEMAADIRRCLRDEPIVARPQSAVYQLRKFAKRNRALVVASQVVLLVLIAGVTVSSLLAVRAVRERDRANLNELSVQRALASLEVHLYHNNIYLADREWTDTNINHSDQLLREAPAKLRNWEWNYLVGRNHAEDGVLAGHHGPILALEFVDGGARLRTVSSDRTFKDWDVEARKEIATGTFGLTGKSQIVDTMDLTPDGRILTFHSMSGPMSDSALLAPTVHWFWNLSAGREVFSFSGRSFTPERNPGGAESIPVAFSPDGKSVSAAFDSFNEGPVLRAWDITKRETSTLGRYAVPVRSLFFSPNSSRLVVVRDTVATVVDAASGQQLVTLENSGGTITRLAFSSDFAVIAAGTQDQNIRAWKTADGTPLWTVPAGTVTSLAFSRDSTLIAAALSDRTILILNSRTGRQIARLTGHTDTIRALRFAPNGKQLVSAGDDGLVRIWNLTTPPADSTLQAGLLETPVQVTRDGRTIVFSTTTGVKLWHVNTGQYIPLLPSFAGRIEANVSSDGSRIVALRGLDDRPREGLHLDLIEARTGRQIAKLYTGSSWIGSSQISIAGGKAAFLTRDMSPVSNQSDLNILDTTSGKPVTVIHIGSVLTGPFRFSPDARRVAIIVERIAAESTATHIEIYDTTTGRSVQTLAVANPTGKQLLAYSADGNLLAEVVDGKTLSIWDLRRGAKVVSFPEFGNGVFDIAFSPDGTRLVSVSPAGEVWLWDSRTGKALIPLRESGSSYSLREVTIVCETKEQFVARYRTVVRDRSISFDPTGRRITMTSVAPDPKGFKVRISTWDGSPRR